MTDQAVDAGGVRLSGEGRFLGRTRELKELLVDIERAGLDTLSGKKAPRARVLLIAGRPGSARSAGSSAGPAPTLWQRRLPLRLPVRA